MEYKNKKILKWILSPLWIPLVIIFSIPICLIMLFTLPMASICWLNNNHYNHILESKSFWECWKGF